MSYRVIRTLVFALAVLVPAGECLFAQSFGSTRNETIAGGVAGAIIGGIVGNQNDETPEGIAIGAAVGALAGNVAANSRNEALAREQAYRAAVQQQQFAQQQIQQQNFQRAASIQDVIAMTQNGIGPDVIANHLQNVGVQQEVGVNEIITLHNSGVNESVITLMQQIGSGQVAYGATQTSFAQPVIETAPPVVVTPTYVRPTVVAPVLPGPTITVNRYQPRPSPKGKVYRHGPSPQRYGNRRPPAKNSSGIYFRY